MILGALFLGSYQELQLALSKDVSVKHRLKSFSATSNSSRLRLDLLQVTSHEILVKYVLNLSCLDNHLVSIYAHLPLISFSGSWDLLTDIKMDNFIFKNHLNNANAVDEQTTYLEMFNYSVHKILFFTADTPIEGV